jgi:hypothetical protein
MGAGFHGTTKTDCAKNGKFFRINGGAVEPSRGKDAFLQKGSTLWKQRKSGGDKPQKNSRSESIVISGPFGGVFGS